MRCVLFPVIYLILNTQPIQAQWQPTGPLASIPVIPNCTMTGGDIAIASPQGVIFYCPMAADRINALDPGAGHFYYVHEYGHFALNTMDEGAVDCWAAQQLKSVPNGQQVISAMINHLLRRQAAFEPPHPRYGSPGERAERIRRCAS